jgi:hypothetical protein
MLTMTTFRHVCHMTADWPSTAAGCLPLSNSPGGPWLDNFRNSRIRKGGYMLASQASAEYAEQVRALHHQLASADTPARPRARRHLAPDAADGHARPAALATVWVAAWLAEDADQAARICGS